MAGEVKAFFQSQRRASDYTFFEVNITDRGVEVLTSETGRRSDGIARRLSPLELTMLVLSVGGPHDLFDLMEETRGTCDMFRNVALEVFAGATGHLKDLGLITTPEASDDNARTRHRGHKHKHGYA